MVSAPVIAAALGEQGLGLLDVVDAGRAILFTTAGEDGRGETLGRRAVALEQRVDDRLPVDRHGQGLPNLRVGEPVVPGRVTDGDDGRVGNVDDLVGELRAGRGQVVAVGEDQVERARLEVRVDRGRVLIGLHRDLGRLGLLVTGVVRVRGQLQLGGAGRNAAAGHLEGTVADRIQVEGGEVLRRIGRDGAELGTGEQRWEQRVGFGQGHLERHVVDHLHAGQFGRSGLALGGVHVLIAIEDRHLDDVDHGVLRVGGGVPRVGERLGGHRLAVVEGPAVLDGDRPDLLVVGLDGLGDRVHRLTGRHIEPGEPGEDGVVDVRAAGTARHQVAEEKAGHAHRERTAGRRGRGFGRGSARSFRRSFRCGC